MICFVEWIKNGNVNIITYSMYTIWYRNWNDRQ